METKKLAKVLAELTIRQLVDLNQELVKQNILISFRCGKLHPPGEETVAETLGKKPDPRTKGDQ